jgi:methionine-rich copper-binding protein CopC
MKAIRTLCLAACAWAPALVLAHTHLEKSVPAANSSQASMPAQFELQFSQATRLTALNVAREGGVDKQDLALPTASATKHSLPAPRLGAGNYVLQWRGLSGDGHVMSGTLKFSIAPR